MVRSLKEAVLRILPRVQSEKKLRVVWRIEFEAAIKFQHEARILCPQTAKGR